MMGHKICFHGEIWLIIPKLSLLSLLIWSTVYANTLQIFAEKKNVRGFHSAKILTRIGKSTDDLGVYCTHKA